MGHHNCQEHYFILIAGIQNICAIDEL